MDNYIGLSTRSVLEHHGVKGMKWGVRKLYDNHKQNLLYQYKKKGYTDEQAQEKLNKRLRNEKIVLGTAAAAAAAGATVGLISSEAAMTAARKLDEKKKRKETRT